MIPKKESKDKHYHSIERRSGSFCRAIRLPVEVEKDKIEAAFKDGVLTLRLMSKSARKARLQTVSSSFDKTAKKSLTANVATDHCHNQM